MEEYTLETQVASQGAKEQKSLKCLAGRRRARMDPPEEFTEYIDNYADSCFSLTRFLSVGE